MAKRPAPAAAGLERRFDAAAVGRISVTPGEGVIHLDLWHWSLKPDATLTIGEAQELVRRIEAALGQKRAARTDVEDPYGVG